MRGSTRFPGTSGRRQGGWGGALALALAVFGLLPGCQLAPSAGPKEPDEEAKLIQVLQAAGEAGRREAACVRLQRIGTERSVPALAALLADPQLAHAARHALEAMPNPRAGEALLAALAAARGPERIGLISSLAGRREAAAAPLLGELWSGLSGSLAAAGPDGRREAEELGAAIAAGLGELDDAAAREILRQAWVAPPASLRPALADALLRQAQRRAAAGATREAHQWYAAVRDGMPHGSGREAATAGWLRTAPPAERRTAWAAALAGPEEADRAAALGVLADFAEPGIGPMLTALIPSLSPDRQVAVMEAWIRRPDLPDRTVARALLGSPDPAVRRVALAALGRRGGREEVGRLLELAAEPGSEQRAARQALVELRDPQVAERLGDFLTAAREDLQAEAARALGERGDRSEVARLLGRAAGGGESGRIAALRALALVAGPGQLDDLVRLVRAAPDESRRQEVVRALTLAGERLQPAADGSALRLWRQEVTTGHPELRAALLPVAGVLSGPAAVALLRAATHDAVPEVRLAAARAAARSQEVLLLPDLETLAREGLDEEARELATRACVRLSTRLAPRERLGMLRRIAAAAPSPAQKRVLLSGVSGGGTAGELEFAVAWVGDDAVRSEAAAAVVRIAPRVADAELAQRALALVAAVDGDEQWRKERDAAHQAVAARAAWVTAWLETPLRRVVGREATELLEVNFGPELALGRLGTAADRARVAEWGPMRVGPDARYAMLLRPADVTVHGVGYACTWLEAPEARPARLVVHHDHGVKVWLNGREVLRAEAAARLPPRPPAVVAVELRGGRNVVLVKFTQPGRPAAFALQVTDPTGAPIPGLRADPEVDPGKP
jgi:HEAT repeat protein